VIGGQSTAGSTTDPNAQGNARNSGTAAGTSNTNAGSSNAGSLPQTASPLPFLGLMGAGSLASGLWLIRRKLAQLK